MKVGTVKIHIFKTLNIKNFIEISFPLIIKQSRPESGHP